MFKWLFTDEFREKRKKAKEKNYARVPPVVFPKKLDGHFNYSKTVTVSNASRSVTTGGHKYELLENNGNKTYKKDGRKLETGSSEWDETEKAINQSKTDLQKDLDKLANDLRNMFK